MGENTESRIQLATIAIPVYHASTKATLFHSMARNLMHAVGSSILKGKALGPPLHLQVGQRGHRMEYPTQSQMLRQGSHSSSAGNVDVSSGSRGTGQGVLDST